jgi:hypothetical protein
MMIGMIDWLTKPLKAEIARLTDVVRLLEEDVARRKVSYITREEENCRLRKELQLQRVLIDALRAVNASLDTRCNDLERRV